jgi:hypothetical protein
MSEWKLNDCLICGNQTLCLECRDYTNSAIMVPLGQDSWGDEPVPQCVNCFKKSLRSQIEEILRTTPLTSDGTVRVCQAIFDGIDQNHNRALQR